ncbi:hypothetical protein ABZ890_39525 [Streptomyces sp. NPDC046984]|uniref:hypothetical protein n=1 Tax=Streptomyces sp. NPDC046984 TaxID=3155138 RepID=UPI0034025F9F
MSARDDLAHAIYPEIDGPGADQLIAAYRAEVFGEAIAALQGLHDLAPNGLRAHQLAFSVGVLIGARDFPAMEKSSPDGADATPGRDATRELRLEQLLDTIRTHGGKWTTGTLQALRRTTGGPVQRGTARRDLIELTRRGYLAQFGAADGRYYMLKRRGGDA